MKPQFKKPRLGGAVYVLPNLLTTGNLFFGFVSIVKALQGQFAWAAMAILLASVFDILDGRVARLTNSTSEFGVQFDSLCDLVSFGLAPAVLMYQFGLNGMGRLGWIACFLFLACGALRLARFNVQSSIGKALGDFVGLPIPMAALVVATFVATQMDLIDISSEVIILPEEVLHWFTSQTVIRGFLILAAPLLALAMVSNFEYRSHKVLKISGIKPFRVLSLSVVVFGLIAYEPELVGFLLTLTYAASGFIEWALGWKKQVNDDDIFAPNDDAIMEPPE